MDLEERICQILRKKFRCTCALKPRYCKAVVELVTVIHEVCEEEVEAVLSFQIIGESLLTLHIDRQSKKAGENQQRSDDKTKAVRPAGPLWRHG